MFPTTIQYTFAMLDAKRRFATLDNVCAVLDDAGEPIFRACRHSVLFLAKVNGELCSLRFFTSEKGVRNYEHVLKNEICMDNGNRYDVVVQAPFALCDNSVELVNLVENRVVVEQNGRYGFADENGAIVVEPKYDAVETFSESRAIVCLNNLFGLIDMYGNEMITPIWDELSYDGSALCYVESEGLCGVIDRTGAVVVEPQWDWTGEYCHGMLLVERGGKYGFLDETGSIAIDIKYDDASSFDSNGYATVTLQSRQYQIDTHQHRV